MTSITVVVMAMDLAMVLVIVEASTVFGSPRKLKLDHSGTYNPVITWPTLLQRLTTTVMAWLPGYSYPRPPRVYIPYPLHRIPYTLNHIVYTKQRLLSNYPGPPSRDFKGLVPRGPRKIGRQPREPLWALSRPARVRGFEIISRVA